MSITMTGQQVEVTEELKTFTEKKLKKLHTYFEPITKIHVTFRQDKLNQIAEAQMSVPGTVIHAEASSDSLYTSVDFMYEKLMRQLTKHKEKINERH